MFRNLLVLSACALALAAPSAAADDGDAERLRIHGSNTLGARLVPALVASWLDTIGYGDIRSEARGPQRIEIRAERDGVPLVVEIDRRGTASGIDALIDGRAELAMATRPPSAGEREAGWQLGDLGSADQEFVVALDGVAVIVHAANPVRRLTMDQLRGVLAGEVRDWAQLGGAARPVSLHVGASRRASTEFVRERVLGGRTFARDARVHSRSTWLAGAVAIDRGAIGIVSLRTPLPPNVRALAIADGGEAIAPTRVDVMSEDYPLTRRLTLYGGQTMTALGRSFALYAMGRGGQRAVARSGHLAVTLRPVQSPAGTPSTTYGGAVEQASRLPLSFRFNPNGALDIFDSRTVHDLERLAAFMRLPQNRGRSAVVVAFAARDGGSALMSTMASNDRADIVANRLQQLGVTVRRSRGLGAARPLAAPSRPDARFRNERVEVWLL